MCKRTGIDSAGWLCLELVCSGKVQICFNILPLCLSTDGLNQDQFVHLILFQDRVYPRFGLAAGGLLLYYRLAFPRLVGFLLFLLDY